MSSKFSIVALLLILDWLALDDLNTSQQLFYFWEYAMLLLSGFVLMFMIYNLGKG